MKPLTARDLVWAITRVVTGLMMALLHGWPGIPPAWQYWTNGKAWAFIDTVAGLGFPAPAYFATGAALLEFVGGLMLAAGLFTRTVAGGLAVTMAVAVFHHLTGDMDFEMATLYLVLSLLFLAHGGGRLSVDDRR